MARTQIVKNFQSSGLVEEQREEKYSSYRSQENINQMSVYTFTTS